jgi:hypothetical protein
MEAEGYVENWICYKSTAFSAKELTVYPGRTVTLRDGAAYGLIAVQGHGRLGVWEVETPALIRYGQLTQDEFFVTEGAARAGITLHNPSRTDPLVMLKHFGPGNPDLAWMLLSPGQCCHNPQLTAAKLKDLRVWKRDDEKSKSGILRKIGKG